MALIFKSELSNWLKIHNLDSIDFLDSWLFSVYGDGNCLDKNLSNVSKIEKIKKGASKILYDENGITRFDRMSPDFWINQIGIKDTHCQYGMFVFSRHDDRNAFGNSDVGEKLEKISGKLFEHNYLTRCIEVKNKIDLARKLSKQDIIFGNENKIEYLIFVGHGSPNGIVLSQDFDEKNIDDVSSADFAEIKDIRNLNKSDFSGSGFKKSKKFFVENPSINFISCSVGGSDGFAQSVSKTYNSETIAVDKHIIFNNISVVFDNRDKPSFDIEYEVSENANKNTFSSGEIKKQQKIEPSS